MLQRKYLIYSVILWACTGVILAKPINVTVQLTQIDAQKTVEKKKDHLFFTITEYPSLGDSRFIRVPMFPEHWLSTELTQLKSVNLWQGVLADDESVVLVISLLDQKFELLEEDKLIGNVQVEITNKKGKISAVWGIPKYVDEPLEQQPDPLVPRFQLSGEDSLYVVVFKVVAR